MVVEPQIRPGSARWLAAAALAATPALLVGVTYALWSTRLPDPMATHWDRRGGVDGTTGVAAFATIMIMAAAAGGLLGALGAAAGRWPWRWRRILVCAGAAVASFAAGLWLITAWPALDHADASRVASPTWQVVALLVGTGLWALLAFTVCGSAPAHRSASGRPDRALPRVDLRPGERAVWSEVAYPGKVAWLLLAWLLLVAGALAVWANPWAGAPVLLTAVLVFLLFTIRLVADRRGVRVGFGPWGWPRVVVPLREIESAESVAVRPSEWGGWGYRVWPGGRAVVTRGGPGVRLCLSESRVFVATSRDPETVAGLVNSLVDRDSR